MVHVHMYAYGDQKPILGMIPQVPSTLFSSETGSRTESDLAKWTRLAA